MDKYKCTVCGYVYDEKEGDPDRGIDAGTPFAQLPDSWVCPLCGAEKDKFEKEGVDPMLVDRELDNILESREF